MKNLFTKTKNKNTILFLFSLVLLLAASTIVSATMDKEQIPDNLKLKASKDKILGYIEKGDNVKYAYNSGVKIKDNEKSNSVLEQAQKNGLQVGDENINQRTKNSRTYKTNNESTFVIEIISGAPQFYQDEKGEWWQAEYATTTKDEFFKQTKVSFIEKLVNKAIAVTEAFYSDSNPETTTVDGRCTHYNSSGDTWSNIRNGSGIGGDVQDTTTQDEGTFLQAHGSNNWQQIARTIFLFDTSSIPDTGAIQSATLSIRGYYKEDPQSWGIGLNVYSSNPSSNTSLANGDYDSLGTIPFSSTIEYDDFSTSGYNDFSLNANGIANISKTGVSKFGMREANYDAANIEPTWASSAMAYFAVRYADYSGTDNDPKLVVVYSSSPTAPTELRVEGQEDPNKVTDNTPEFYATYNDSDQNDYATHYRLQVATSSNNWEAPLWDSGLMSMATTTQGSRSPSITYGGTTPLIFDGSTYYWRIKFSDSSDLEGAWSSGDDQFTMASSASVSNFLLVFP